MYTIEALGASMAQVFFMLLSWKWVYLEVVGVELGALRLLNSHSTTQATLTALFAFSYF
jgi:hypothetical protein